MFERGLSGKASIGVTWRHSSNADEAAPLLSSIAGDDPHCRTEGQEIALEELDRVDDDHAVPPLQSRYLSPNHVGNGWVDDVLEPLQSMGIAKYDRAKLTAVDASRRAKDLAPECLDDLVGYRSSVQKIVDNPVGIDACNGAEAKQKVSDGSLAAGNGAGQS